MNVTNLKDEGRPWFKYYPTGVDPHGNYPRTTLAEMFENTVARFPEHRFLTFMGKTTTYAQTNVFVKKLSIALARFGVRRGDRVAFFMPNCPQEPISFLAAVSIGAIAVPLDPSLPAAALAEKLKDSGAEVMICLDLLYPEVKEARKLLNPADSVRHIIVASVSEFLPPVSSNLYSIGYPIKLKIAQWETAAKKLRCKDERCVADMGAEEKKLERQLAVFERAQTELRKDLHGNHDTLHCFHEIIHKKIVYPEWNILEERYPRSEDPAVLFYTSGTTGSTAKGAELSHDNLVCNTRQCGALLQVPCGTEIFGGILPFSHTLPNTASFLSCIERAGELLLVPDPRDIKSVKEAIVDGGCTIAIVVPKLLMTLSKKTTPHDWSGVKLIVCGGAPLPDETKEEIEKLAPGKLRVGYGATELSPVVSCNPAEEGLVRHGSSGIPVPGTDVKIMTEGADGKFSEAQEGTIGRIYVKGRQVFLGYWNAPEKTAQVLTSDDWFITSDLGWMEDGYLYIKDRADDVIVLESGEKVYPSDVELALKKHPAVEKVAIAGIPGPRGKEVVAFIVCRAGREVTEKEIVAHVLKYLRAHNVPKVVRFLSELPELPNGKLRRFVLIQEEVGRRCNLTPS
jgi:long-chain acyl-CoA synthetase